MRTDEAADRRSRGSTAVMGVTVGFKALFFLAILALCSGDLERTFSRCCNFGAQWARNEDTTKKCSDYPAPVYGVATEHQGVCLSTVAICCLNSRRRTQCEKGMVAAESGGVCTSATEPGGEYHKDCCEACKLGTFSGSMDMGCGFEKFSFGFPWDEAYRTCCLRAQSSSTVESFPNTAVKDRDKVIPNSSSEGMCDLVPGLCAHICISEPGSFRCACRDGFSLMADGKTCQQNDLPDRCKTQNPCEQICLDTGFSIECSCGKGYTLGSDERSCEDIDECALKNDVCTQNNLLCRNEPGGYSCINSNGSVTKPLKPDREGTFPFKKDSTRCPAGYHYNLESKVCDDIDECAVNPRVCGPVKDCQNTIGSFKCMRIAIEDCPPGYQFNISESTCTDINECEEGLSDCDPYKEFCLNTEGNFTCQRRTQKPTCPAGYKLGTVPGSCEDVDECAENIHSCIPEKETCRNTVGAYECDTLCVVGFQYSRAHRMCVDINECETRQNHCPTSCINTIGSYRCSTSIKEVCPAGYKPSGLKNMPCIDVNECAEGLDACDRASEQCVNEIGHYKCDPITVNSENTMETPSLDAAINCPPGLTYNIERRKCLDVCAEGMHTCSPGEVCLSKEGGYSCNPLCGPGYRVDPATLSSCIDIDECQERLDHCRRQNEICENTNGSFKCSPLPECQGGYRRLWTGRCEDINECEEDIYLCNPNTEVCINEPGAYRCGPKGTQESKVQLPKSCPAGFKSHPTQDDCVDIDECSESSEPPCDDNQICENQHGGYECKCKPGYQFDTHLRACVDINECQTNQHDCSSSQRCDNTMGSYQCIRFTSCGTGYTLNAQSGRCEDDDECVLGSDNCRNLGPTFQCRNTLGSFRCEKKRCGEKQVLLNTGECRSVSCPPGLEPGYHGNCVDINECERPNICRRNQRCINTKGSYGCVSLMNCPGGFELNEAGTQCIDIDECARGIHECTSQQTCHNRNGGYTCKCPPGHIVNERKECEDINECSYFNEQVCPSNSVCENNIGSYYCKCNDGFKPVVGENTCADVNECEERPGVCHQKCVNVWGSYRCLCEPGYALQTDDRTCRDVDECEEFKDRNLCIGICVNEPGSYKCQCPDGYRLGSDGRTCQDINECATGTPCTGPNEVCVNTLGSFRCPAINCPPGFSKDPAHRNRCKRDSFYCLEADLDCFRRPSSYSYNFIAFVSNIAIPPSGPLDLFTMRGLVSSSTVNFVMNITDVRAPLGIPPATKEFFLLRHHYNQGVIALVRPIKGPQEIELQLVMELHQSGFSSRAIAKLFMYVSEYEF